MSLVRVGDWIFDPSDGRLRSAARVTRIEPKVQAVLQLLIHNPGQVVSQEVLWREVWHGTHVAPGALARTMSVLRQALGDDVKVPRYIETVPKRGYRLIAPVALLPAPEASAPEIPATAAAAEPDRPLLRHRMRVALVTAILAMTLWPHHGLTYGPSTTESFYFQFRHDTRLGNEDAYEHYSRALARDPQSAAAQVGLATVYVFRANYLPDRQQWVDAAIESALRALKIDPASVFAARALGMAHAQAGRLQDAARVYRRVLDINPSDGATCTNLGRVLLSSGRVADALELYERHLLLDPHSAAAYAHLADGLAVAGYAPESAEAAVAALAFEPNDRDAQLVLVRRDVISADYDSAAARLHRLLQVHPDCVQCVVHLGLVDQLTNQPAPAAAKYRAAIAMSPSFAAASLRLAQVLKTMASATETDALLTGVERAALDAIADGVEWPLPRWQLAAVASIRGHRQVALEWYRQAVAAGRRDRTWDRWDPLLSTIQLDADFLALQEPSEHERRGVAAVAERLRSALRDVERHRPH